MKGETSGRIGLNNLERNIDLGSVLAAQSFSKSAVAVLAIGLIAVAIVAVLSLTFAPFPSRSVQSSEEAKQLADQYLATLNSDLAVKEVMEFSNQYYVRVQEKSSGINALELLVDRNTGTMFYEPGPNMMWNTKYGHMGRISNPTAVMPTNPQQAVAISQTWLNGNFPDATANEPETFYGYYTIDFSRDGHFIGMLSVNGYNGEVWYHTWHGQFISEVEY